MKKTFFWVLVLEGLVGLHRTIQLLDFSITCCGIDLGYCDTEWFALETNRYHSVVFEIASKYCISDSFVDYDGHSTSCKWFLPTIVYIMIISVKLYPFESTLVHWFLKHRSSFSYLLFDHFRFALINGPNIPGSCAILPFKALDFTSIPRHSHNWVLFLLWLCLFILSGVISPLISSSIWGTN